VSDPVAFATARLDEEQHRAEAMEHESNPEDPFYSCPAARTPEESGDLEWGEEHCDCHLAARKAKRLREIAALRAIVALHKPDGKPDDEWYGSNVRCTECGGYNLVAGYGAMGFSRPWPCRTLRNALAIWADHPDYDEEKWKP
jgi:hypothetical protein